MKTLTKSLINSIAPGESTKGQPLSIGGGVSFMRKYLKVVDHWMMERGGEIQNVFHLEDGSFHYTRLLGDYRTTIQSEKITQEEAEEKIGHILPSRVRNYDIPQP